MNVNRLTRRPLHKLLIALFSLALIATACGSDGDSGTSSSDGITMAIVAPSAQDDLAFTQSMIDAIDAVGITPKVTDGTFIVEEAGAAIRGYAEEGIDIVIAHGTQFGGPLEQIAPDFPDTTFLWGTATDTKGLDNVFAYYPEADQGGYVQGVIAAALTQADSIGVVGPVEAGDAVAYVDGFVNGVVDGGASIPSVVYTGSFGDVALAKEAAEAHLASGVDIMTGSAQMVVGATGVAVANDILWFGTQANQTALGPDIVVASQVYHWEVILEQVLALREEGIIGGQVFALDLENGGLEIEYNDGYDLPDSVKAIADATIAGLIDGSMNTGVN